MKARWEDPARILSAVSRQLKVPSKPKLNQLPHPCAILDAKEVVNGQFVFINQAASLGRPVDWLADGMPRLWRYNLHYFDWMWSLLPEEGGDWKNARQLIQDWIDHHPPSKSAEGWEPYPTSLRLINWSILVGLRYREELLKDSAFQKTFLQSIEQQARWLSKNLETHIQANHLLENLAALTCVASVFEGPACDLLGDRVAPILERELIEQVLPDGMHYERSPMYHLRVLWLVEMLSQLGNRRVSVLAIKSLILMRQALDHLRHPDGEIALLNDASIGIYRDSWQREPSIGPWSLPDAGYFGFRSAENDYLIVDAGAIGPDHQPGHAHADLLSFELSLAGHRVVTDTGVGTYEIGPQRFYDRSTAAHSTVQVDGENSVEVWSGFRVGRRAVPKVLRWEPRGDECLLEAEHYGYTHLPSRAIHRRTFEWKTDQLEIRDQITISESVCIAGRIHLSPEVEARLKNHSVFCRVAEVAFIIEIEGPGKISLEESLAFYSFGQSQKRKVMVVQATATPPLLSWTWRIRRA